MKTEIPEALKQDLPHTTWGKILTATPVIMTVVSTMLAGLASSEMTRAQYSRSTGAQQQAKAGDQWSFFQAKRLRGSMQRGTLDLLQATAPLRPLGAGVLTGLAPAVVAALQNGEVPASPAGSELPADIKAALAMLENARPDEEVAEAVNTLDAKSIATAERAAHERADALDAVTRPVNQAIDTLEKSLAGGDQGRLRDFTAARLRYTATRYDAEARLNQTVAQLIELEVRKSNLVAERHHRRSQRFFFGMLGAQAAVIVSTFSLAARNRSMLWTVAAGAGLAAISFAIYVYFYV
jgi:hypothetical protein